MQPRPSIVFLTVFICIWEWHLGGTDIGLKGISDGKVSANSFISFHVPPRATGEGLHTPHPAVPMRFVPLEPGTLFHPAPNLE